MSWNRLPEPRQELDFYDSRKWLDVRYRALKKSDGRCSCCGNLPSDGNPLQVDHIKPRSKFPDLELVIDNLQVLCRKCNKGKGNWDQTDWRGPTYGSERDFGTALRRKRYGILT